MKKLVKILLIIGMVGMLLALAVVGVAFIAVNNTANADTYELSGDTIQSVKTIVGKRTIDSVSSEIEDGVAVKEYKYQSDSVQEDLLKYTEYLRGDGGFVLTKDMDLSEIPSEVVLAKESNDDSQVIIMTIEYDAFGYEITIEKGEGTLNLYE